MSADNDERLMAHEYDGIRELDNDLPIWWLATFGGTIIFAFVYWIHYQVGGGPTNTESLNVAMSAVQAQKGTGPSFTEDQLNALFTDQKVSDGRGVFAAKCAACHGPEGGGLIGPNLTDKAWLHGRGTREDLFHVISKGVPEMGMPAWGEMLPPDDVIAAAAFVHSIKGTNVPGGKPAQGAEAP